MAEHVTIVSPMRDSLPMLNAFMTHFECLDHPPAALRLIVVEGDSVDGTPQALRAWADQEKRLRVVTCDLGAPKYGSIVSLDRFRVLATVFNAGLDAVDLAWSDYVMFIPSDVDYQPDLLSRLLAHKKDIIAPFFWMAGGDTFWDTWGFTGADGTPFTNFSRTHLRTYGDKPIRMETVGGVVLIRAAVLWAGVRYSIWNVDRGLCASAQAKGFTVWADPTTHVTHR